MSDEAMLLRSLPASRRAGIASRAFAAVRDENPLYSSLSHRYYQSYAGGSCDPVDVVVLRKGEPVLFLPLSGDGKRLSYFGEPARLFPVPPGTDPGPAAFGALLATLVALQELGYAELLLIEDPRVSLRVIERERLEVGIVDLEADDAGLRRGLRKSYKSLVNWGQRNLAMALIDAADPDAIGFRAMRDFHRKVAGRLTRSDETWEIQLEMIRAGEAFAVLGNYQGRLVAANLVIHGSRSAYYGVGVYDRELMAQGLPLAHGLLFRTMLETRARGMHSLLLGDVTRHGDAKLDGIATFKRGFASRVAGETRVLASVERRTQ